MQPKYFNTLYLYSPLDTLICTSTQYYTPLYSTIHFYKALAAKISKSVTLLYKAKHHLPSNSLLTLYYALIYPYLTYCNLIWAFTYLTNLQWIYLLQKRAVQAISKADYKASSKPLFANLKIFYVFSIYIIMMLYLFLSLKSFKLETNFINIQQDTPTITDLIPVEQILKNFWSCSKVLEYGIHYRLTSKMLLPLVYSSVWSNHF